MNLRTQSLASVAAARPPFRAEHIGSLLRPAKLLRERARFAKGEINTDELAAAEDDAIVDAIRLQERLGFKFVTDGEFRRRSYHSFFYGALGQLRIDTIGGADAIGRGRARWAGRTAGRDHRQPCAMDPSDQCRRRGLPQNPLRSLAEDHDSGALRASFPRRRCRRNGKRIPGRGSVLVGYD